MWCQSSRYLSPYIREGATQRFSVIDSIEFVRFRRTLICTSNIALVLTWSPSVVFTWCAKRSLFLCLIAAHCSRNALSSTKGKRFWSFARSLSQSALSTPSVFVMRSLSSGLHFAQSRSRMSYLTSKHETNLIKPSTGGDWNCGGQISNM